LSLFRSEAITQHTDRLSGDVAIAVPVPWQIVGYVIFGSLAVAMLFLSLSSYSRVETVVGTITPDKGVTTIIPSRSGTITRIDVTEGQAVDAGTMLVSIRSEADQQGGATTSVRIEDAIARQDESLALQVAMAERASIAQQGQIAAQQSGLLSEISQLQQQIVLQESLVSSAKRDYNKAKTIADRGFISLRDLQVREDNLLSRQQQLLQLKQNIGSRRSALAETERSAAQIAAQASSQAALISANRAQVAQQAASTQGSRSFAMRAPVDGRVTALTARTGQSITPQNSLMSIVPKDAKLRAELSIPTAAIGFIQKGQDVRIAIDAFPYQRFGTIKGKILTVAESSVSRPDPTGRVIPIYLVSVELLETSVSGFGKEQPLVSGMTLSARIVTEEQSLLEWLFEPLFAVKRR